MRAARPSTVERRSGSLPPQALGKALELDAERLRAMRCWQLARARSSRPGRDDRCKRAGLPIDWRKAMAMLGRGLARCASQGRARPRRSRSARVADRAQRGAASDSGSQSCVTRMRRLAALSIRRITSSSCSSVRVADLQLAALAAMRDRAPRGRAHRTGASPARACRHPSSPRLAHLARLAGLPSRAPARSPRPGAR